MERDESGVYRLPRCATCCGPVERERHCYAIPTCYGCLPPPEPLPVATFRAATE